MSSPVGKQSNRCRLEVGVRYVPSQSEVAEIQNAALAMVFRPLASLPIDEALATLNSGRAQYDAMEASLLAAQLELGASTRSVELLLQKGDKTSKRTAKTRTRRAKAVKENPGIATKIESGVLSPDQADVIASAADKTGGDAAETRSSLRRWQRHRRIRPRRLPMNGYGNTPRPMMCRMNMIGNDGCGV